MIDRMNAYSLIVEEIAEKGLKVEMIEDADAASRLLEGSEKPYATPHIMKQYNDLTSSNHFWLFLLDQKTSEVEGVIAVRFDNLDEGGFNKFWNHHYKRMRGTKFGGSIDESYVPPALKRFYGPIIYIGDLYLNPKRKINQTNLMMLLHVLCVIKWGHAKIGYAFLTEKDALRGQPYRLMFTGICRNVHRWIEQPEKRDNSDALVWIDYSEFDHELRNFLQRRNGSGEGENKIVPIRASNG